MIEQCMFLTFFYFEEIQSIDFVTADIRSGIKIPSHNTYRYSCLHCN